MDLNAINRLKLFLKIINPDFNAWICIYIYIFLNILKNKIKAAFHSISSIFKIYKYININFYYV